MDLLLFGIQGSGKGTQARRLVQEEGYTLFETGAELRTIASSATELGQTVSSYIDQGNLAPFDIVMQVVRQFVETHNHGSRILFDGIPRDKDQMHAFDALMKELNRDFLCIELTLNEEEAMERIKKRALEQGRADDASEEFIRRRMGLFHEKTEPVIKHYIDQGKVIQISGEGTMDEVYQRMKEALSVGV